VRLEVQLVLEKEAHRNFDQPAMGCAEGQQRDQYAEIDKNAVPHRFR